MARTTATKPRELAHRTTDGLEVSLLWEKRTGALTLAVLDVRLGVEFALPVASDRGLEAFYHPFAFAASHGVELRADVCEPEDEEQEPIHA